ncbi:hypothetical protein [Photobacterium sanguinicancri]|uniref:Uncharacterized protein n=1 Tax=Photobacterium sanguinicancri TaxID=875932 RepID=A0AAW7YF85_9GAMM|nr:hypothetical protein [Photobacterium sanguinicancri]MDO6545478.1 hypothetical protein [Photobacterium sanguinicancri]
MMAKLGYCEINGINLSRRSRKAVSDVKEIMRNGNIFSTAVSTIPLFQIFASPSITTTVVETGITIREYHWDLFARAMNSAAPIVRNQIFKVAYEQEIFTYGKEREFCRCVSEASK